MTRLSGTRKEREEGKDLIMQPSEFASVDRPLVGAKRAIHWTSALGQPFVLSDDLIGTNDACRFRFRCMGGAKPFYQIGRSDSHWLMEGGCVGSAKTA
jgi:hypothetical protein